MSVRNNIHFPNHIDLDEFIVDFSANGSKAKDLQEKYKISPRQYRLVIRYLNKEVKGKPKYYKSPQRKYIYRSEYGLYVIRKRINGNYEYFGRFRNLDEAIEMRNRLMENNWNKEILS